MFQRAGNELLTCVFLRWQPNRNRLESLCQSVNTALLVGDWWGTFSPSSRFCLPLNFSSVHEYFYKQWRHFTKGKRFLKTAASKMETDAKFWRGTRTLPPFCASASGRVSFIFSAKEQESTIMYTAQLMPVSWKTVFLTTASFQTHNLPFGV